MYILWWRHTSMVLTGIYLCIYTKNAGWYIYTNLQLGEYILTWVYILTRSFNSLVLHIVLHITLTESFWHYCYRKPMIPFHKPHSPTLVTNSPQYHALYSNQSSSIVTVVQTLPFHVLLAEKFIDHVRHHVFLQNSQCQSKWSW